MIPFKPLSEQKIWNYNTSAFYKFVTLSIVVSLVGFRLQRLCISLVFKMDKKRKCVEAKKLPKEEQYSE